MNDLFNIYVLAFIMFCFVCIPTLRILFRESSKKLYFMHPINTYGTKLEKDLIFFLKASFPGWEIVNPNMKEHQDNYDHRKKETGNGMSYFEELALSCSCGVALDFRDDKLGAGVFKEISSLLKKRSSVWIIKLDKRMIYVQNLKQIEHLKLSVAETKERIRDKKGNRITY